MTPLLSSFFLLPSSLAQGTYASAGENIPRAIARLGPHITFVHFRDVVGSVPKFREAWQDTGDTDMVGAIQAYDNMTRTNGINRFMDIWATHYIVVLIYYFRPFLLSSFFLPSTPYCTAVSFIPIHACHPLFTSMHVCSQVQRRGGAGGTDSSGPRSYDGRCGGGEQRD